MDVLGRWPRPGTPGARWLVTPKVRSQALHTGDRGPSDRGDRRRRVVKLPSLPRSKK